MQGSLTSPALQRLNSHSEEQIDCHCVRWVGAAGGPRGDTTHLEVHDAGLHRPAVAHEVKVRGACGAALAEAAPLVRHAVAHVVGHRGAQLEQLGPARTPYHAGWLRLGTPTQGQHTPHHTPFGKGRHSGSTPTQQQYPSKASVPQGKASACCMCLPVLWRAHVRRACTHTWCEAACAKRKKK